MVVSFRFFLTLNPDDGSKPTPTMETHVVPEGEGKFGPHAKISNTGNTTTTYESCIYGYDWYTSATQFYVLNRDYSSNVVD